MIPRWLSMRRLAFATGIVLAQIMGCSPATSHAPSRVVSSPLVAAEPAALARGPLPLSIQRIVAEERSELLDAVALGPVGDAHGRVRAASEVNALADELAALETELRAAATDSDRLDATIPRLLQLATRIEILHDRIRVAAGPTTAVEIDLTPAPRAASAPSTRDHGARPGAAPPHP
jgi:hypothetical protein